MQNNYFKPKYPTRLNSNKKEESIEKNINRREKFIASYTDKKSIAIARSSAFNGAADICVALLHNNLIHSDQFWDEHKVWYQEYLDLFLEKQEAGSEVETPDEKVIQINDI